MFSLYRFIETNTIVLIPFGLTPWLIGFFTINIVGGWWLRESALKIRAQDREAAVWFNYQHHLGWLKTTSWIWVFVAISSVNLNWLGLLFEMGVSLYLRIIAIALFTFVPPILTGLIHCILSHKVAKEVAQLDYRLSEVVIQYVSARVGILLSLLFIPLLPLAFEGHSFSFLAIVGIFIGLRVCEKQTSKLENQKPYAVTTGELRDRIFELAKSTGIELKQFYVMPMARSRTVNAFALSNNTIMITDYLLDRFTKAEVDSVLAHELGHLQLRHPQTMRWFFWIVPTLLVMLCVLFLSSPYLWIVFFSSFAVICVSMCALSRRFEYAADAQAVVTTQDPRSLITGLVKVAKLSQMPMQWGKFKEFFLTHPSMQRRVEAIARTNDIPPMELKAIVSSALTTSSQNAHSSNNKPETQQYQPDSWQEDASTDRIFSSEQKQKLTNYLLSCLIVCFALLPTCLGCIIYFLPTPGLRWIGYLAATGAVIATYLAICDLVPVRGYNKFKDQLADHLSKEGFDLSEAMFIGFSPDKKLRVYEGCSNWDIGFLLLRGSRCYYIGEKISFALSAMQITKVEVDIDTASLPQQGAVVVTWQSDDLAAQAIRFQMLDAKSVRDTVKKARSLQARLEDWQSSQHGLEASMPRQFAALKSPNIGEVTSQPLSPFSLGTALVSLSILWAIATSLSLLISLGALMNIYLEISTFIYLMPAIGVILQAVPAIRRDVQRKQKRN